MCLLQHGRRVTDSYSRTWLHVLFLVTGLLSSVRGQSWITVPTDKNVTVGGSVLFECEVADAGSLNRIWNKGVNSLFINGQRNTGVPDRYKIEGYNNLKIENVELSDDSEYLCDIFSFGSAQVTLTVMLPPGPPTINNNSSSYVENSVISFTCSSAGGKPAPTLQWLRNGQPINSAIVTPPATPQGTTSSQIVVTLQREDHRANYSCIVFNAANQNSPLMKTMMLDVQYSPSISFTPDYNPYHVKRNTQLNMKCNVESNPPYTSLEWFKNGILILSSTPTLSFASIEPNDTGNYTCTAKNYFQGSSNPSVSSASVFVNVIYAPTVTTKTIIVANISSQVNMSCHVDANPPARQIRWQKLDSSINDNGPNFIFTAQKRYDGNYSCTAVSRLEPSGQPTEDISSKGFTTVKVRYAPGRASLNPTSSVLVGESATLICSVDDAGYPLPIYEWRRTGSATVLQNTASPTYTIGSARLADNGDYTCLPKNMMGDGVAAMMKLEVNSPPVFVQSNPPNALLNVAISHQNLLIEHKIEGRPLPIVQWYKDGVSLSVMANLYNVDTYDVVVEQYKYKVTSRLTFIGSGRNQGRLRIEDTGNYTCQVMSPIAGSPVSASTMLSVEFSPQVTVESPVAALIGETATLRCHTQANPFPAFYWYKQGQRLSESTRVMMGHQALNEITAYEGYLQIRPVTESDFGDYTCEVNNTKGSTRLSILLSKKDKPSAPTNLAAIEKTWESVKLKWDAGFDGGYEQNFHIVLSSVQGEQTKEVHPLGATAFNVTRLMPQTSYTFRVYGRNKLGKGENSAGFTAQTEGLVFPPLKDIPEYKVEDKQLVVPNELDQSYCLRIDVSNDNGKVWTVVEPCAVAPDGVVYLASQSATNVNVSVCLVYRPEVCGEPVKAEIHESSTPDLTKTQVIIIGCVCAGILIILLVVLICIICRRRQKNKNYTNDPHSPRTVQQSNGTVPNQKPRAYDNQDGVQSLENRNGYPQQFLHPGDNYPMGDTSYDSHTLDKQYEYEMNRRNANLNGDPYYNEKQQGDISFNGSPQTPTKDPQQFINLPEGHKQEGGSFGSGHESGYSTPDHAKPKKNWKFNPSIFHLRHHARKPNKNLRTNPDMIPYSHNPPGHTCGLPCCSGDLQIQVRVRRQPKSCIGIQDMDVIQQNFTFRGRQLLKARPELESGFFSVQQPKEVPRGTIPKFGSMRNFPTITEDQRYNFLKGRGITLPESVDPLATEKLYLQDFNVGESDDILNPESSEEIEYYMTMRNPQDPKQGVPYSPNDLEIRRIYPWDLMNEMKENGRHNQKVEDSSSSDYYEVLRYPDERHIQQQNKNSTFEHTRAKQFPPVPPKPPSQNAFNHPPLSKPFSVSNHTNGNTQYDFKDQNRKTSDTSFSQPPKYNTYNTVYSINSFANQATRNAYDKYLSLDRMDNGRKSFRRDARDIDFSGGNVPFRNKNFEIGSVSKARLEKILQRNKTITENLKAKYTTINSVNGEKRNIPNIYEWGSMRERFLKREEANKIGEVNLAYQHQEEEGSAGSVATRVSSTDDDESLKETTRRMASKLKNIDGKMHRSTCSINAFQIATGLVGHEFQRGYVFNENEENRNSLSDSPITLIL